MQATQKYSGFKQCQLEQLFLTGTAMLIVVCISTHRPGVSEGMLLEEKCLNGCSDSEIPSEALFGPK